MARCNIAVDVILTVDSEKMKTHVRVKDLETTKLGSDLDHEDAKLLMY